MAFDTYGFIIRYEDGECTTEEMIEGFQALIDSGLVWGLQGSYGRTARQLIEDGHCHLPKPKHPAEVDLATALATTCPRCNAPHNGDCHRPCPACGFQGGCSV
jgi:hypothetical protein